MKKVLFFLCFAPLLMATMCEDDDDQEPCTTEAVYGLNVRVSNAVTGENLSTGVVATAVDGEVLETLQLQPGSTPPTFVGAVERAGTYVITVSKTGFVTFVSDPVQVTADRCHVNGQLVQVNLQPQ